MGVDSNFKALNRVTRKIFCKPENRVYCTALKARSPVLWVDYTASFMDGVPERSMSYARFSY